MYQMPVAEPHTGTRLCQTIDRGQVHGAFPCNAHAVVHCLRTGEDLCRRHEPEHSARVACGQGEHMDVPQD
jgi:hypothetical protein